jgi:DNA-binding transcriptional LysR family regulator
MTEPFPIEVFVRVADAGSFTKAAAALGVSKSYASRVVSELEDRLGARLLQRTTRRVALTDVGTVFRDRCRRILEELHDAETAVIDQQSEPRGTLRVTLPIRFGIEFIAPAAAEFAATHEELEVELVHEDRRVDLVEEGFDLAIRIGALSDSTLVARKLGPSHAVLCASPKYLAKRGTPARPEDLRRHECLLYTVHTGARAWTLRGPRGEPSVPVNGRFSLNNGESLQAAARAGLGIAFMPDIFVAEDLREGRLVRVLPEWGRESSVWALYPHSRHLSAKVRQFVDFLARRFADPPWTHCRPRTAAGGAGRTRPSARTRG